MKHFYSGIILALWPSLSYAQLGLLEKMTGASGATTYIRLDPQAAPQSLTQASTLLRTLLELQPADELRRQASETDALGYTTEWYWQYYQGVRVEDGAYLVNANHGRVETLRGEVQKITSISVLPALSESAALAKCLSAVGATVYRWQLPAEQQWLRKLRKDSTATFYPKAELLVSRDNSVPSRPRLTYKFTIYAAQPASAQYVYVDARSGEVFRRRSMIQSCVGTTPATSRRRRALSFRHPVDIQQVNDLTTPAFRYNTVSAASTYHRQITTQYVGFWRLGENGRHPGGCGNYPVNSINTRNMLGQYNFSGSREFQDQDNNWTAAEYNNANKDNAALDAHWGAEMTIDYFDKVHCRTSYNGTGGDITTYAHTSFVSVYGKPNNDMAAWDPMLKVAIYGDGGTPNQPSFPHLYDPLTSLDVVAHELGHGYAQSMINQGQGFSQDMANYPESSAINEGLSDIWGACVEQYTAPDKQTWLIGEQVALTASCIRNMAAPNTGIDSNTSNTKGFPDVYKLAPYWDNTSQEPHTNSTILSHWFFLLAQGGTGPNSAGTAYQVTGIGIDKASKIVFLAEKMMMYPTIDYPGTRQVMIDAASQLYGCSGLEVAAVKDAWYAVGIGTPAPVLMGPSLVCSSPVTFSLDLDNLNWSTSPANAFSPATGNGRQFTTAAVAGYTGSGTITATVTSGSCAGSPYTKSVQLNTPPPAVTGRYQCTGGCSAQSPLPSSGSLSQYSIPVPAGEYNIYLDGPPGPFKPWQLSSRSSPGVYWYNTSGTPNVAAHLVLNAGQSAEFTVTRTSPSPNSCSASQLTFIFTAEARTYAAYRALPNPASSDLTITPVDEAKTVPVASFNTVESTDLTNTAKIFDASLFDTFGNCVKVIKHAAGRAHFDTGDLPAGLYNLQIVDSNKVTRQHIEIAH